MYLHIYVGPPIHLDSFAYAKISFAYLRGRVLNFLIQLILSAHAHTIFSSSLFTTVFAFLRLGI